MTITDTHSHIYGEEFTDDISEVVERAREAGVGRIFLPNINAESIAPMLSLCHAYPGYCHPMLGLHPEDVNGNWRQVLAEMEKMLDDSGHPFIGIGEIGLDYYWSRDFYEEQKEALATQLGWAMRHGLPAMIHTRNAHREMVETITAASRESPNGEYSDSSSPGSSLTGVFHCFGGSEEEAAELLSFPGFMLGIGGVVTFRKSPLPDVLRSTVPLSRIVVETDSPYLAPVPHRGKRNESAYVTQVVAKLADIYGTTADEVAEITTNNALKTFPKGS